MKYQTLHVKYSPHTGHHYIKLCHQYDTAFKTWRFKGYKCRFCNKNVEKDELETHESKCKVINFEYSREYIIPDIVKTNGEIWEPIVDLGIKPV